MKSNANPVQIGFFQLDEFNFFFPCKYLPLDFLSTPHPAQPIKKNHQKPISQNIPPVVNHQGGLDPKVIILNINI
jgi:hypothetical protein